MECDSPAGIAEVDDARPAGVRQPLLVGRKVGRDHAPAGVLLTLDRLDRLWGTLPRLLI